MNKTELHNKFIKTVEVLKNIKGSHIDVAKVWGVKLNAVLLNDEKSWLTINLSSEYLGIEKIPTDKWDFVIAHIVVIGGKYHCSIQRVNETLYGIEVLD